MDKKGASLSKEDNSFGIASVVLGILGIVSIIFVIGAFFAPFAGIILGIISMIFAIKQRKHHNNSWANAGIILSSLAILINLVLLIWIIQFAYNELLPALEQAAAQAGQIQ